MLSVCGVFHHRDQRGLDCRAFKLVSVKCCCSWKQQNNNFWWLSVCRTSVYWKMSIMDFSFSASDQPDHGSVLRSRPGQLLFWSALTWWTANMQMCMNTFYNLLYLLFQIVERRENITKKVCHLKIRLKWRAPAAHLEVNYVKENI